ncbi:class I SAM-dependent methyltransferase [Anaerolinea thermophila]|uniref:Ubiquinone/menaquinone biosynthesis methyltransferase n=1 Tax=Anaerolinea thermophila (strain DSM 14523 / JCM 11388 / NBRC 100420 / UNI-1) TaxID=926569 RepID=E8N5I4_ANATU|nr:class I SAM-dependent methyltransferase [Anaerolinea thermophila]BAJ63698.1 putative ubiquinone/menaquinone biosynthesis methyltransferase [Anaerolinea thermophila UNI-1]
MNWRKRILYFLFDLLYHPFAWAYDFVAAIVSLNSWQKWVTSIIPFLPGETVLELGCGTGYLMRALRSSRKIIGIDLSPQMIRQTRKRVNIHNNAFPFLIQADGRAIPLKKETFDHVVATFPAPYLFEEATLRSVQFALKPGGSMVVLLSAVPPLISPLEHIHSWVMRKGGVFEASQVFFNIIREKAQQAGLTPVHLEWTPCLSGKILVLVAVKSVQTC